MVPFTVNFLLEFKTREGKRKRQKIFFLVILNSRLSWLQEFLFEKSITSYFCLNCEKNPTNYCKEREFSFFIR